MTRRLTILSAWLLCAYVLIGARSTSAQVDFREQIAPLFERRCVGCHNDQQEQGGFSLQTPNAALSAGHIVPEAPDASHLLELITSRNGKAEMPKDADPLSDEEVHLVREWIREGAQWPAGLQLKTAQVSNFAWWAYQPLQYSAIPESNDPWAKNAIDRFVLAKLIEKGLRYSPPADRRTLIRRLTYDLIGLPPTPDEVAAFVEDTDPQAYEKLVSRLLDSSHYGEHWARHWLDVAKYADSCGYDKDKLRPNAWPYRDYVIRSFNNDKPYRRFVQEQLAGDVLFPDDPDGIVGLGFLASGPWDFIGHVEVSESKIDGKIARNLDRDDMVSGVFNTFCSLTVQCARCHNHKFDPITQEQYYGLQSVFAAVDRAERTFDENPAIAKRRKELQLGLRDLTRRRQAIDDEITLVGGVALANARIEVAELEKLLAPSRPPEHGYHSQIAATSDAEKWVEVELPNAAAVHRIVLHPCSDDFNGIGDGFGFPIRFNIQTFDSTGARTLIRDESTKDFPSPGIREIAVDIMEENVLRVRVTATKLVSRGTDFIFSLAELEVFSGDVNMAFGATVHSMDSIESPIRWSQQNLVDGKWPRSGETEVVSKLDAAKARRDALYNELLDQQLIGTNVSRREQLHVDADHISKFEAELKALPTPKAVYAAATDFKPEGNFRPTGGQPRQVFVLNRGEVTQPGPRAVPGVVPLSELSQWQFPQDVTESEGRAKLAEWMVSPENPLVWRSIVNRVWQYHFGDGIVATPNDFGRMGDIPTHPELLDHLAITFRDGNQSIKELHRSIVLTNTYQQASDDIAANSAIDGGNQFLWRANRRRLSAEEIRDSILTVSGAMNPEMGGPGYYLFALEKTDHSPHFEYHRFNPADKASHRRSIYQFIARSQPNPFMTTLDCADSSQSTPRRNETLTSLQALTLLNNKFNLVMAEKFAKRLENERSELDEQIQHGIRLLVQRMPTHAEAVDLSHFARSHGLPNLCRLLFNLSEFIYVD